MGRCFAWFRAWNFVLTLRILVFWIAFVRSSDSFRFGLILDELDG